MGRTLRDAAHRRGCRRPRRHRRLHWFRRVPRVRRVRRSNAESVVLHSGGSWCGTHQGLESPAQVLHRAKHAVLGRARLAAQHAAHIVDTHACEMPQYKRGAFRSAQFGHSLGHAVADFSAHGDAVWPGVVRGEGEHGIVHRGIRRRRQLVTPFAGAHEVERAVDGDAIEPGAEAGALVEPGELFIRPQEAVLHYILRVLLVASHTKCEPEQGTAVALHEHPKRVGIARPRLGRSEEHTSELQSRQYLVCRLLLEKKKHHETMYHTRILRAGGGGSAKKTELG